MTHEARMADLSRTPQEEHFRRWGQELVEQGRLRRARELRLRQLGDTTGICDRVTLEELFTLGHTADTVQLLHLLPLVMVAWADGTVSSAERGVILEAATVRHVGRESLAWNLLVDYLTHRPSEQIIDRNLRLLRTWMQALPGAQRIANLRNVTSRCTQVASVSRGSFGVGRKISEGERRVMDRLASFLARSALW